MKYLAPLVSPILVLMPLFLFPLPAHAQVTPDWRAAVASSAPLDVLAADGTFYHPMPGQSRCLPYELRDGRLAAIEPYPVMLVSALGIEYSHEVVFERRADQVFGVGTLSSSIGTEEDLFVVTEARADGLQLTSYPDSEAGSDWYLRDRVTCLVAMKDLADGGREPGNGPTEEGPSVDERSGGIHEVSPPPPAETTDLSSAPTFTPYTVRPEITNRSDVIRAIEREYPPLLRDAGIGGTTNVWFFIDESGRVLDTRIQQSSGHASLDAAALRVAGMMRFSPALNRDKKVPVWVAYPITFQVR